MPDDPTAVVPTTCQTCDGLRVVGRRWTNRPDGPGGRIRVRAAALVPCPTCTTPREIER